MGGAVEVEGGMRGATDDEGGMGGAIEVGGGGGNDGRASKSAKEVNV